MAGGGGGLPNKPIRYKPNFGFARPHQQTAFDHPNRDSNPGFVVNR